MKTTTLVNPGNAELPIGKSETKLTGSKTMKALVFYGPGKKSWEEKPMPTITKPTDAIVKILKTTICGTDLQSDKGYIMFHVKQWITPD